MPKLFERIRSCAEFPTGYTKEQLCDFLRGMGISRDDTLMLHCSVRSVGSIQGGAQTLIEALCECLRDGLLLIPTHTWATIDDGHSTFDPAVEPSCTGILGEVLLQNGGIRSLNVTHSMAVWGRDARLFVENEQFISSPGPRRSCMGRLLDRGGKILLCGVGFEKCTFIHSAEEWYGTPDRLSEPALRYIVTPDSGIYFGMFSTYCSSVGDVSANFPKLEEPCLQLGAAAEGVIGDARCLLCDCRSLLDITTRLLILRPDLFSNSKRIPKSLVDTVDRERRKSLPQNG